MERETYTFHSGEEEHGLSLGGSVDAPARVSTDGPAGDGSNERLERRRETRSSAPTISRTRKGFEELTLASSRVLMRKGTKVGR